MTSTRALTVAAVAAVGMAGTVAAWAIRSQPDGRGELDRAPTAVVKAAEGEAASFLDAYVDERGRVVRRDHGGDTVSEGQAYAMLLAVGAEDPEVFDLVWTWTVQNLQRDDGLLSWRWADGAVADQEPAADADLDAAWALALAERRWPGQGYGTQARRLAEAIEAHETATTATGQRVLAAGPWAMGDPVVVNPSYASPVAEAVLADGRHVEPRVAASRSEGNREVVVALLDQDGAPPDWARLDGNGGVSAIAGPSEAGPGHFGWDAVRVPLRYGASCVEADRRVASRTWEAIRSGAGKDVLGDHPARLIGAASAAAAAGERRDAERLLDEATRAARAEPTYYGDALVALGRLLLHTTHLGGCPALRP